MKSRIDYQKIAPGVPEALGALERYVHACGLEAPLLELVKVRASQINGCARCMQAHAQAARKAGVTQGRLDLLPGWRESPGFSDRERAALAWCEAVTLLTFGHVPDGPFEEARRQFSEKELADLTLAVAGINAWNRMNVALRALPEPYRGD